VSYAGVFRARAESDDRRGSRYSRVCGEAVAGTGGPSEGDSFRPVGSPAGPPGRECCGRGVAGQNGSGTHDDDSNTGVSDSIAMTNVLTTIAAAGGSKWVSEWE
jgi:hypothetical protein